MHFSLHQHLGSCYLSNYQTYEWWMNETGCLLIFDFSCQYNHHPTNACPHSYAPQWVLNFFPVYRNDSDQAEDSACVKWMLHYSFVRWLTFAFWADHCIMATRSTSLSYWQSQHILPPAEQTTSPYIKASDMAQEKCQHTPWCLAETCNATERPPRCRPPASSESTRAAEEKTCRAKRRMRGVICLLAISFWNSVRPN